MAVILVAEDDRSTRLLTCARLKSDYTVIPACDGQEAYDIFYRQHIDLIVCDWMMPRMDGHALVKALREDGQTVPVIMLTAKSEFADKKEGFSTGVDDYMTKPFSHEELSWRIEALLRRSGIQKSRRIEIGAVTVDEQSYSVTRSDDGTALTLPKKEFDLLFKLLSYPGQIFTKDQLLEDVWGFDTDSDDTTVKVHVSRLRSRFEGWPEFSITTVRGLGYKGEIHGKA